MEWVFVAMVACMAILAVPIIALFARRRWLTGQGGLFDCAHRFGNGQWNLGFARYRGDALEWFRAFSVSLSPSLIIRRGRSDYVEQRVPTAEETDMLFENSLVVLVRGRHDPASHVLAMEPGNVMGLMAWLESAPPGTHVIPGSADSPL